MIRAIKLKLQEVQLIRIFIFNNFRFFGQFLSTLAASFSYLVINSKYYWKFRKVKSIRDRYTFYQSIIDKEELKDKPIMYLEFGVWEGNSFKYWAKNVENPSARFIGFDTFTGLSESWNLYKKGTFNTDGKTPHMDDTRCSFEVGYFQHTMMNFIKKNEKQLLNSKLVIHLDADLYSSTIYVLVSLAPFIKPSDILIFDEFFNVLSPHTEFRAFLDYVSLVNCSFEPVAKTRAQCSVKINQVEYSIVPQGTYNK